MISVICCYNDKKIYEKMLLTSLSMQTCEYELIGIDNMNNVYSSMAQAYNDNIDKIHGQAVLFCHQDIFFTNSDTLKIISEGIETHPDSIVGLCGIDEHKKVFSNLKYKKTNAYISSNQLTSDKEVLTIDECCYGMSMETLKKLGKYDEEVCDNWHLYATEMCLRAKLKNLKGYVIPVDCYHRETKSTGNRLDKQFLYSFSKIRKKYKKNYKNIYSVCLVTSSKFPQYHLKMLKLKLKLLAKRR